MLINKESYCTALWWYAYNYHNGQDSELYQNLINSSYNPSPLTEDITDETETPLALDYYISLVKKYQGDYPEPDLELTHYGDISTLQSHKGCLVSLYFEYAGNYEQTLDSFKESFWDEAVYINDSIAECLDHHAVYINERLSKIFSYLPLHLLASNAIDGEEVACWIKVTI